MTIKRSSKSQNAHDNKVKAIAKDLKKDGYIVKADLPGYKKPDPIGKDRRIPDIQAQKRGRTKLIEVETKYALNTDRKQQSTFVAVLHRGPILHSKLKWFNLYDTPVI